MGWLRGRALKPFITPSSFACKALNATQEWEKANPFIRLGRFQCKPRQAFCSSAKPRITIQELYEEARPAGVDIITADLSPRMISKARQRDAQKAAVMDVQHLPFRDGSFYTVVSTLGTCTLPDPVEALREMRRVSRPRGHILLLENGSNLGFGQVRGVARK